MSRTAVLKVPNIKSDRVSRRLAKIRGAEGDLYPKLTNLRNLQYVLPTVKLEEHLRSCGHNKNNREKMAALFLKVLPFVQGGNQNLYYRQASRAKQ